MVSLKAPPSRVTNKNILLFYKLQKMRMIMYPNTLKKKIYQFPIAAIENCRKISDLKIIQMCYLMIPRSLISLS